MHAQPAVDSIPRPVVDPAPGSDDDEIRPTQPLRPRLDGPRPTFEPVWEADVQATRRPWLSVALLSVLCLALVAAVVAAVIY